MPEPPLHQRLLAALLLLAAVRTLALRSAPPPADLLDPQSGPPTVLPDLAHDDWVRLTWLPEVGEEKARAIVAARPRLRVPLTLERLHLVPGCGPTLQARARDWYRRQARGP